jgi:hypothetical protein
VTLAELENSLPNGLHDAELVEIQVDFVHKQAVLRVNVDMSESDGATGASDPYRPARIRFAGAQFVVIDPPGAQEMPGLSLIDTGSGQPKTAPCSLPATCEGCFLCWIFVSRWNSFIRISARSVMLEWDEPADTHA